MTKWSVGHGGRWSWPRPTIRSGSRRRPCWGSDWAGRATCPRAWPPTSRSSRSCPPRRTAHQRIGYGWRTDGCVWSPTTWWEHAPCWSRRRRRRCGRGRCGSRCGPSSGPHTPVSRWEPGTRRPPTPTERCPCWKKPDTNGYAHWRDARPCWSRQPAENGPPPKNTPEQRPPDRATTNSWSSPPPWPRPTWPPPAAITTPCSEPWNRYCSSPPATASTNRDSGPGKASTATPWSTRAG